MAVFLRNHSSPSDSCPPSPGLATPLGMRRNTSFQPRQSRRNRAHRNSMRPSSLRFSDVQSMYASFSRFDIDEPESYAEDLRSIDIRVPIETISETGGVDSRIDLERGEDGRRMEDEEEVEDEGPKSCMENFKDFYDRYGIRHIVPIVILAMYSFLGASIFYHLEHSNDLFKTIVETAHIVKGRKRFAKDVASMFAPRNATEFHQAIRAINSELVKFQEETLNMPMPRALWSYTGALFYCGTLYTTIGYGTIFPHTSKGKLFTIFYALFGIPLLLAILADLGGLMSYYLTHAWNACLHTLKRMEHACCVRIRGKKSKSFATLTDSLTTSLNPHEEIAIPALPALIITLFWLFACSALFAFWEREWSYFDAFYFFFISLTTIGLGDVAPYETTHMLVNFLCVMCGLIFFSMCITVLQQKIQELFDKLLRLIKEEYQKILENEGSVKTRDKKKLLEKVMKKQPWYMRQLIDKAMPVEKQNKLEEVVEKTIIRGLGCTVKSTQTEATPNVNGHLPRGTTPIPSEAFPPDNCNAAVDTISLMCAYDNAPLPSIREDSLKREIQHYDAEMQTSVAMSCNDAQTDVLQPMRQDAAHQTYEDFAPPVLSINGSQATHPLLEEICACFLGPQAERAEENIGEVLENAVETLVQQRIAQRMSYQDCQTDCPPLLDGECQTNFIELLSTDQAVIAYLEQSASIPFDCPPSGIGILHQLLSPCIGLDLDRVVTNEKWPTEDDCQTDMPVFVYDSRCCQTCTEDLILHYPTSSQQIHLASDHLLNTLLSQQCEVDTAKLNEAVLGLSQCLATHTRVDQGEQTFSFMDAPKTALQHQDRHDPSTVIAESLQNISNELLVPYGVVDVSRIAEHATELLRVVRPQCDQCDQTYETMNPVSLLQSTLSNSDPVHSLITELLSPCAVVSSVVMEEASAAMQAVRLRHDREVQTGTEMSPTSSTVGTFADSIQSSGLGTSTVDDPMCELAQAIYESFGSPFVEQEPLKACERVLQAVAKLKRRAGLKHVNGTDTLTTGTAFSLCSCNGIDSALGAAECLHCVLWPDTADCDTQTFHQETFHSTSSLQPVVSALLGEQAQLDSTDIAKCIVQCAAELTAGQTCCVAKEDRQSQTVILEISTSSSTEVERILQPLLSALLYPAQADQGSPSTMPDHLDHIVHCVIESARQLQHAGVAGVDCREEKTSQTVYKELITNKDSLTVCLQPMFQAVFGDCATLTPSDVAETVLQSAAGLQQAGRSWVGTMNDDATQTLVEELNLNIESATEGCAHVPAEVLQQVYSTLFSPNVAPCLSELTVPLISSARRGSAVSTEFAEMTSSVTTQTGRLGRGKRHVKLQCSPHYALKTVQVSGVDLGVNIATQTDYSTDYEFSVRSPETPLYFGSLESFDSETSLPTILEEDEDAFFDAEGTAVDPHHTHGRRTLRVLRDVSVQTEEARPTLELVTQPITQASAARRKSHGTSISQRVGSIGTTMATFHRTVACQTHRRLVFTRSCQTTEKRLRRDSHLGGDGHFLNRIFRKSAMHNVFVQTDDLTLYKSADAVCVSVEVQTADSYLKMATRLNSLRSQRALSLRVMAAPKKSTATLLPSTKRK